MDEDNRRKSRKPKYRSREKVAWSFTLLAAAAYNLIRLFYKASWPNGHERHTQRPIPIPIAPLAR